MTFESVKDDYPHGEKLLSVDEVWEYFYQAGIKEGLGRAADHLERNHYKHTSEYIRQLIIDFERTHEL